MPTPPAGTGAAATPGEVSTCVHGGGRVGRVKARGRRAVVNCVFPSPPAGVPVSVCRAGGVRRPGRAEAHRHRAPRQRHQPRRHLHIHVSHVHVPVRDGEQDLGERAGTSWQRAAGRGGPGRHRPVLVRSRRRPDLLRAVHRGRERLPAHGRPSADAAAPPRGHRAVAAAAGPQPRRLRRGRRRRPPRPAHQLRRTAETRLSRTRAAGPAPPSPHHACTYDSK
ncbi:hypothetical protein ONE63_006044 [Megalurothrips usitatus]|uniref:Uncharacterized protein n=1 Tax=Megalurothrips usitatus TaxID=439358 RepID=A0AAV7XUR5_9NEOP|nr:hypothetical protein ONE63_006044 [Megalurothrips usitatus]